MAALTRAPLGGRQWDDEQDETLLGAWDAGLGLAALAERLGRSPRAVAARLVRLGVVGSREEARRRG